MLNSVNCSTVICSPTVEYLCSWEKPLVKPMAPGSILIISIYITLFTCFVLLCLLLFTLHLSIKNTKNIIYLLYQISLSKVTVKGLTTSNRVGCEELSFCVGTRDLCVVSYWIDTLVLKNWGKYLCYFTASSSHLRGNPMLRNTSTIAEVWLSWFCHKSSWMYMHDKNATYCDKHVSSRKCIFL